LVVARILDAQHVTPALAAMLGCADVDGGPTAEQRALIDALAVGYFHTPVDLDELPHLAPADAGAAFATDDERRRMRQLLVLVELCRHPLSAAQVARTERYTDALGGDPATMAIARDMVSQGLAAAEADYFRSLNAIEPGLREPSLAGAPGSAPIERDPALAERLRAMQDGPDGSLGREYLAFYERYGFALPGTDDQPAALFVAHDMSHVISGYEPSGVGEIALGAMQLAMHDNDEHWVQMLGNLGVHEAGFLAGRAAPSALAQPGAVEIVAHAFERGAACPTDFTVVDHLARAGEPLEAVRREFGVPPRER
jgi:hypothetical protein